LCRKSNGESEFDNQLTKFNCDRDAPPLWSLS